MVRLSHPLTILLLGLILLLPFLAGPGCKKAPPPPVTQAPVAVTPKQAAAPATPEPAKEEEKVVQFRYVPGEYRSPFGSLLRVKKLEAEGVPEEMLTPLQRVPVTDMRVESIIISKRRSVAHVITPDGKAHIVALGTPMGRHKGKVVRITQGEVVVEEQFQDYLGREFKQETVLRLREQEGESL